MHILFVEYPSVIGGAQRSLLELMRVTATAHRVALACPEGALAMAARALGVNVVQIPESQLTFRLSRQTLRELVRTIAARRALRAHVARLRPDVIHANSLRAGLLAIGLRRQPPLVVHCRDLLPPGPTASLVKKVILGRSRAVVAVSRRVAERFAGPQWTLRGVEVVDNPVDTHRFDPAKLDAEDARRTLAVDGGPVIGVIAQITPWKGQTRAVRVLERLRATHPGARLLIAGETKFVTAATRFDNRAYERELHELVARLDLGDAVHFLGEREDAERVVAALDVLLVPSTEEPFGRTIIEALAMGVPVVATDAGGPPEIIRSGVDGEVLPPDDVEAWARAVGGLAARGRNVESRVYAVSRFSPTRHGECMMAVYSSAIAGTDGRGRR